MKQLKKGFTLIELLVVIAIIALLAGIIIVNLSEARAKSRDAKRKADLQNIRTALEMYNNTNFRFPSGDAAIVKLSSCVSPTPAATGYVCAGQNWIPQTPNVFTPTYLQVLPKDPRNSTVYQYLYSTNIGGTEFKLSANTMETEEGRLWASEDNGISATVYELFSSGGKNL